MVDRPFVYICSPYRGDTKSNTQKAQAYSRQVFETGYTPLAPHLLFPQFLKDDIPEERQAGMEMGLALLDRCKALVVCGTEITEDMKKEIQAAERLKLPILTLDVFMLYLSVNTKDRPPAALPSVLEQIAAARVEQRNVAPKRDAPTKPKSHGQEL